MHEAGEGIAPSLLSHVVEHLLYVASEEQWSPLVVLADLSTGARSCGRRSNNCMQLLWQRSQLGTL